jgi:hypothetical protein
MINSLTVLGQLGMVHVLGFRLAICVGQKEVSVADGRLFSCYASRALQNLLSTQIFYFLNRYCLLFALIGM